MFLSLLILAELSYGILCQNVNQHNEEFCNGEVFKPTCEYSEVVIMKKAFFGRMNIGKCLTEQELDTYAPLRNNPKFYGCFKDVLSFLNEKCAKKLTCEVRITELENLTMSDNICGPGLKQHLNVTYSCLKIINVDDRCEISASNDLKYLDPSQISNSKCASGRKSLSIEAPRGQNIKMSLELFHQLEKNNEEMEENEVMCDREIGTIKYDSKDHVTICSNGFARDRESVVENVFTSHSDHIYLSFLHKLPKNNLFLVKIEAVGCRDIIQPEDMWMQRNGDEMEIGCFMTKQKWYLRCQDRVWSGVIGNCSTDFKAPKEGSILSEVKEDLNSETQILMMVLVCGVGVVLCSLIVCVGAVCMRKYSIKKLPTTTTASVYNKQQPTYYLNDQSLFNNNNFNEATTTTTNENNNTTDENKYFVLENE